MSIPTTKPALIALSNQLGLLATGTGKEMTALIKAHLAANPPPPSTFATSDLPAKLQQLHALRSAGTITEQQYTAAVNAALGIVGPSAPLAATTEVASEDVIKTSEKRLDTQISSWFVSRAAPCFKGDAYEALSGKGPTARCRQRITDLTIEDVLSKRLTALFLEAGDGVSPTCFSVAAPIDSDAKLLQELAKLGAWAFCTKFCGILAEEISLPEASPVERASFRATIADAMSATSLATARNVFLSTVTKIQTATGKQNKRGRTDGGDDEDGKKQLCTYCRKGPHLARDCQTRKREEANRQQAPAPAAAAAAPSAAPAAVKKESAFCTKCNRRHDLPICK